MYNKIYIGQNAAGVLAAPAFAPISRIALLVDDENEYLSGDDSGRTLEVTCPYGSQAMADDLLAQLKGYTYQPMTAQDALLDPAAEIGDGVTVGGVYTILAQIDRLFDMHCAADIAAPGEEELESEYTFQTQEKRLERKLAQTRSLISKTAEEVKISVEELNGKYTALSVTLDGVTITDPDGTTKIKGSSIETGSLYVDAAHITGKLTANQVEIDLSGSIKWTDLSADVQNEINDAYAMAEDAEAAAADAADTVDGWRYNGGTYIDGRMLMTGTVKASELLGGSVGLMTSAERTAGGLDITGASTSTYAIQLWSYGALRLEAYNGAAYVGSGNAFLTVHDGEATLNSGTAGINVDTHVWIGGNMFPTFDENFMCGNSNFTWSDVWAVNVTQTSARRKKKNITYGLDRFDAFFDDMKGCSYQMVNGTSGRFHNGFIADDIRDNLAKHGISTADFAGYVEDVDKDGNPTYGLRYSEFIPLLVDQVQKLKARVAELEDKKL